MALTQVQQDYNLKGVSDYEEIASFLELNYCFRYNVILNKIECQRLPQLKKVSSKNPQPKPEWTELNENKILFHINAAGYSCQENRLGQILSVIMDDYNAFAEYLEELPAWDKKTDHIGLLAKYIKVKDGAGQENYLRWDNHFKKHMVRTVACAINDEYVNKHAIIFTGGQNAGKSTFCRFLCPPALRNYFTENINADKDSIISLCTNILINLDELASITKFELNQLKSMMSKQYVNIRVPFAKRTSLMPRRCSFIGNTNNAEFLNDHTGSVRWLCFEVLSIDFAYSKEIDINQVYAQAYALYKSDFKYSLTREEVEENEKINDKHFVNTPEMDKIMECFVPSHKHADGAIFVTPTYILDKIISCSNIKSLNSINVGRALVKLGFEKTAEYSEEHKQMRKGHWVKELERKDAPPQLLTIAEKERLKLQQ
jgi:predicted P-loop ATPase